MQETDWDYFTISVAAIIIMKLLNDVFANIILFAKVVLSSLSGIG